MGNCKISHLLFADDLLVVDMSDLSSASSLRTMLANFHTYMGLSINNEKSVVCGSSSQILHVFSKSLGYTTCDFSY